MRCSSRAVVLARRSASSSAARSIAVEAASRRRSASATSASSNVRCASQISVSWPAAVRAPELASGIASSDAPFSSRSSLRRTRESSASAAATITRRSSMQIRSSVVGADSPGWPSRTITRSAPKICLAARASAPRASVSERAVASSPAISDEARSRRASTLRAPITMAVSIARVASRASAVDCSMSVAVKAG